MVTTKLLLVLQESEGEAPLALIEHIFAFICWEETLMRSCGEENTHAHTLSLFQPSSLKKAIASFVYCIGDIKRSKLKN